MTAPMRTDPTIDWNDPERALAEIGKFIDQCSRKGDHEGTRRALAACTSAGVPMWTPAQRGFLLYMKANAHADLARTTLGANGFPWADVHLDGQVIFLRKAILEAHACETSPLWLPMALTNLGNILSHLGRPVEAIECWKQALLIQPEHGMARGNLGQGFYSYGRYVYDAGHTSVLWNAARRELSRAIRTGSLEPAGKEFFPTLLAGLDKVFHGKPPRHLLPNHEHSLGEGKAERAYRRWCLDHCLFLNPLNDVEAWTVASHDVLGLPTLRSKDGQPSEWIALFNQLKQEYATARFLFYLGASATEPHFSDRGVQILNTLEYTIHGYAAEQVRLSFRVAYAILDKCAFLLNDYFSLGIAEGDVKFRTIWYKNQKPRDGIREELARRTNPPLRGLHSLSRDLYDSTVKESGLLPDAVALSEIRNHLEHKLLRLHDELGIEIMKALPLQWKLETRRLGRSLSYDDFRAKALRVLRIARAAIIYVSLSIHDEERSRHGEDDKPIPTLVQDVFEDEWKIPPNRQSPLK